jgi:hypothetical protein
MECQLPMPVIALTCSAKSSVLLLMEWLAPNDFAEVALLPGPCGLAQPCGLAHVLCWTKRIVIWHPVPYNRQSQ